MTHAQKIIQILGHTLGNDDNLMYHVYGNWAARQARNNVVAAPKYKNEVWYAVCNLPEEQTFDKDELTYRLFPAKTVHTLLESYHGIITTPSLFTALDKEDPKNTIVHIQGERGSILQETLRDHHQFPIVVQMHGYGQPTWLDWLERIWITPQERKNFPHIRYIFVPTRTRRDYLLNVLRVPEEKISFQYTGVDYERFQPSDKQEARKKLNLPKDAYIMLYVGAMVKTKGVHHMIRAYKKLKKTYPHLYFMVIGANKTDILYQEAKESVDNMIGVIDNKDVPLYYNAADVYCFYGSGKTRRYAGLGVAPSEALACNLNVMSTNLIHFPPEVVEKTGYVPKSYEDFVSKLEWFITHPEFQYNAREIVEPLISSVHTTQRMVTVYDKIFRS